MGRLDRTWQLFKLSFTVLSVESGILLFPVLSAVSAILLAAGFFVPLYQVGTFEAIRHKTADWSDFLPLFSWYYANTFVIVFFNSALVACANIRLSGGDPTVADGFRFAFRKVHRIAAWSLLAGTVGLLLRAVEDRSSRAGKWVAALLGAGWTVMTYLIVPVILFEDRGVVSSVSRSAELFRKTWGEQLASGFGFGLLNLLLCLPGLGLGLVLYRFDHAMAVIVGVVYLLMLAAVSAAVKGIFTVALYRYATEGHAPYGFTPESLGEVRRPQGPGLPYSL